MFACDGIIKVLYPSSCGFFLLVREPQGLVTSLQGPQDLLSGLLGSGEADSALAGLSEAQSQDTTQI